MSGTVLNMSNELHRMFDCPFTQIDNRIFESEIFKSPLDKLLYMTLIKFSFGKNTVFPSIDKLKKHCCTSKQSVIRSMNRLIEMGLVKKEIRMSEKGNFKSNIYHLFDLAWVVPNWNNPSAKMEQGVVPNWNPNNKNFEEQEIKNKKSVQQDYKKFYFENMGLAVPPDIECQLESFAKSLSPGLVIAATRRALEANARRYSFIKKLLTDWQNAGIKTIEEMETFEERHKKVVNLSYKKREVKHDAGYEQRIRDAEAAGIPF